jgi:hypothetical protein
MPVSINPQGITADITNPLDIPVYNPGCTAYIPVNFYTWASPFHTGPQGIDYLRPDSYFTGLTAPVFSDDAHKYTAPLCWARTPRQSESYKATFNNYSVATYGTNIARNYHLTGLTGGLGESSVAAPVAAAAPQASWSSWSAAPASRRAAVACDHWLVLH